MAVKADTTSIDETAGETGEAGQNGDGEKKNGKPKDLTPVARRVSFADLRRTTKAPEQRGIIYFMPEEMGFDGEELGMNPGDTAAIPFRPFKPNEDTEIREIVKDFPTEDGQWTEEYYKEIIIRCALDPNRPDAPYFPDSAEARKYLDKWLPGTRAQLARAIQNQSGMGVHVIRTAKEELGKLQALPLNTSSN